jgi:hypothetical protein
MSEAARFPQPQFRSPSTSGYIYLGRSVAPPRTPVVHRSAKRDREIAACRSVVRRLDDVPGVIRTRVFQAALIPPLKRMPRFDVTMLVETSSPDVIASVCASEPFKEIDAQLVLPADNPVRLGDTETPSTGMYLFNHFLAEDADKAIAEWKVLAGWYTAKTGVDNSLPLRPLAQSPFALVNYARLPGKAVPFLLNQVLRPSFHSFVRTRLRRNGMTALPLLCRPV